MIEFLWTPRTSPFEARSSSDVELHHLATIVRLLAHLLLYLGLILLILKECQHLTMFLL
jgi:hypothetical protein